MTRNSFIEFCRLILRINSVPCKLRYYSPHFHSQYKGDKHLRIYEDENIIIVGPQDTLALTITRKENNNPVVYVDESGNTFRHHGEYNKLKDHVRQLITELLD